MNKILIVFLLCASLSSCLSLKPQQVSNSQYTTSITDLFEITANIQDSLLHDEVILSGDISEYENKESLLFASIAIYENDILVGGAESDFDGHFSYKFTQKKERAIYRIECNYIGFQKLIIKDVNLIRGYQYDFKIALELSNNPPCIFYCPSYIIPLIEIDNTTSGQTITSDQIRRRAARGK